MVLMKRIGFAKRLATLTWKGPPGGCPSSPAGSCIGTSSPFPCGYQRKPRGWRAYCNSCLCTRLHCYQTRSTTEKYLRLPEPYALASCRTFSLMSETTFGSDVSFTTLRECTGTIARSTLKMLQIHLLIYDVPSNTSTASCPTVPNHSSLCRYPIHTSRNTRPCMGTACLVAVRNGGASPGSTWKR